MHDIQLSNAKLLIYQKITIISPKSRPTGGTLHKVTHIVDVKGLTVTNPEVLLYAKSVLLSI